MRYFRATVEYDGTDFYGFQIQPRQPTVQGVLEQVLQRLTGEPVRVLAAGRTDTGVHARGQVIAFRCPWRHSVAELHKALNALLPDSVAVRALAEAPAEFHPRYSARSREYRYRVYNTAVRSPLRHRYATHVPEPLDVAKMNAAAALIVGVHDFATFGDPTSGESTVREVYRSEWQRDGSEIVYIVEANGFLRRMVRTLVTAFLWVGQGRWTVADFQAAWAARDRRLAPPPAPPQGLYLWAVRYDDTIDADGETAQRISGKLSGEDGQ